MDKQQLELFEEYKDKLRYLGIDIDNQDVDILICWFDKHLSNIEQSAKKQFDL